MNTITKKDLIDLGYPDGTAQNIIRQAKQKMVKQRYPFYLNKRLGRLPIEAVESIIGCPIKEE